VTAVPPAPSFPLATAVYLERVEGRWASNVEELMQEIANASPEILFLHAQLPRLRHDDVVGTSPDEFSHWLHGVVQDSESAERVAYAIQSGGRSADELRAALLSALACSPESERRRRRAPPGGEFVIRSVDCVAVPSGVVVSTPEELMEALPGADLTTWFHHLVEHPWLRAESAGLIAWLEGLEARPLADTLRKEAESGRGMHAIRARLMRRWRRREFGRRVIEASRDSDAERRAAEREAAAQLVRRLTDAPDHP
jgi:Family of unknown function (DUF5752)